jgi:enoyl-CoA hydratase/carnithine racemase
VNGQVAHLALNRPAKNNALRLADLDMLVRLLRRPSQRRRLAIDRRLGEGYMAFHYSRKPVIAQVPGFTSSNW